MTRLAALLAASSAMVLTAPAFAQDHSMHNMPGMSMPTAQPQAAKPKPKGRQPAPRRPAPAARPVRREPTKPAQPPAAHQGHDMQSMYHTTKERQKHS